MGSYWVTPALLLARFPAPLPDADFGALLFEIPTATQNDRFQLVTSVSKCVGQEKGSCD
jgi:hypothetical protein